MAADQKFELQVKDVFHFQDGQKVLIGPVQLGPNYIKSQACELLVDGVRRQLLRIEGEMVARPQQEQGYRSVSTKETVKLATSEPRDHVCILRSAESAQSIRDVNGRE
jgi:hypothetical protein